MALPQWARAHGPPLFAAGIRAVPEDFRVTEELGWKLSGSGEHDYLWLEKTGANTEWVARRLARHAGVSVREVGYSGLKDRHAVTRQWFSVPHRNSPDWHSLEATGVRIRDVQRHSKKLRRGAHKTNAFRIVMRVDDVASDALDDRMHRIGEQGVPNYFGEQRFGHDGGNLELANAWASGKRLPRHKRGLAISTIRAFLFNEILSARVDDHTWNTLLPGDKANLDGTGSVFDIAAIDGGLARRCREMDIHPAGVLWGEGAAAEAAAHGNWQEALLAARVAVGYRSLRLRIGGLAWSAKDDSLMLEFRLGRGSYATAVLREIADVIDASR